MPHARFNRLAWRALHALLLACCLPALAQPAGAPLAVGSKRFTESYVLGEVLRQTLQRAGIAAEHRPGLGNTAILVQALDGGAVQLYPEYSGTIQREILKREGDATLAELNAALAPRGLQVAVRLGFNNSYALAMPEALAQQLGVRRISDLAALPPGTLRPGLSHEFQVRADGWPALARAYGIAAPPGAALDHGLAYQALAAGQVNLIDVYSTDAQVERRALRVLQDDRGFFPRYDALLLMRQGLDPRALQALRTLEGRLDDATMTRLNALAEVDGLPFAEVARRFLDGEAGAPTAAASAPTSAPASAAAARPASRASGFVARLLAPDLPRLLGQHVLLVAGSLAGALLLGVPLGVAAWRWPRLAAPLLAVVGLLQTVPSLAMLAFLVAALGVIGFWPALAALWLYALLPIVHNTHAGLQGVPAGLAMAAQALGLSRWLSLRLVLLPLAAPVITAGAQTAAVINVGTATVAAFVGAGGLGERIVAGLAVNDTALMLAGALPAAALALVVQGGFALLRRRAAPAR